MVAEPAESGNGACARLRCSLMVFSLWFGCVVAETCGYGFSSANAPTLARPENSCGGTAGSCVVGNAEWCRIALDEGVDVDWPGGVTRVLGKAHRWCGSEEAWPNWSLIESPRWSRRSAAVSRPGRVVHGKRLESHRRCSEDVATSLLDGFLEERCKVGSADDDGIGVYVWTPRMWW